MGSAFVISIPPFSVGTSSFTWRETTGVGKRKGVGGRLLRPMTLLGMGTRPLLEKAYIPFSFPDDFGKFIGEVNDAGMFRDNDASVNHQIELSAKPFFNLSRIAIKRFIRSIDAGADNGMSQFFDQGETDLIVWDSNPNGVLLGHSDLGNEFGGLQDKRIRPRKQFLHHLISIIGHIGISANVLQISTDETEGFLPLHLFQTINLSNRLLLKEVTPDAVNRVRGIADDPSLL